MSRHRDIRNLNIQDELDDDALSDNLEYEISPEQEAQLNDGLDQVRSFIGTEADSGLSDNAIKEVLWDYYFNVQKTVQWVFEEKERQRAALERKDLSRGSDFDHEQEPGQSHSSDDGVHEYQDISNGSRLPSIFLAQQQPGFDNEAYLAVDSPRPLKTFLSTISERTERTDPSTPYHSRQHRLLPTSSRSFVSSPTTSYGKQLDDGASDHWPDSYNDPNMSRHSPSLSAIELLSKFEPPPSNDSTPTVTQNDMYTHPPSTTSLNHIPTIPDLDSKLSEPIIIPDKSLPPTPAKSYSKLSRLASSKATSVASISSRSSGTSVAGSIKTFPNLRPSAQSERPVSLMSSSSRSLPSIPPQSDAPSFMKQTTTSTSSLVRKAIETAIQLEDLDRINLSTPKRDLHRTPLLAEDDRSTSTVEYAKPASQSALSNVPNRETSALRVSKLALLAQQRADSTAPSVVGVRSSVNLLSPTPSTMSQDSRPISKLAILAQQKVDASKKPKLPKPTTEYLTPIANGSTVTTAITTSYQSLYSLTDHSKPNFVPKLNVVPLQAAVPSSPLEQNQSKLAMKVRRASQKNVSPGFPSEEAIVTPTVSPLFHTSNSTRGPPSAFASVLISDFDSLKDKDRRNSKRKSKETGRKKGSEKIESPSDSHPHRSRKHKHILKDETTSDRPLPFNFDVPSPDDIVLNARNGTSLNPKSPTSSSRLSAGTGN